MKLDSRKILKTSNFKKNRPVGAEMFHAGGRTDGRTDDNEKLTVVFRNFANVPKTAVCVTLKVQNRGLLCEYYYLKIIYLINIYKVY
jgi:hypothetical protein